MFKLDAPDPRQRTAARTSMSGCPRSICRSSCPTTEMRAPAPRPPQPPAPPPPLHRPQRRPARVPAAVALSDDDGAADTAVLSQAEPVLTETMAECISNRAIHRIALRVLSGAARAATQRARLKNKVEKLSSGGRKKSGVSAQAFLQGESWSGRGSQSTLSAAFDVAGPTPGEPSHPAHDHISLDSVFGDEVARRANVQSPEAPAPSGPAPDGSTASAGGSKTGGFSFDEFFAGGKPGAAGGTAEGGDAAAPKNSGRGAVRPAGRTGPRRMRWRRISSSSG